LGNVEEEEEEEEEEEDATFDRVSLETSLEGRLGCTFGRNQS